MRFLIATSLRWLVHFSHPAFLSFFPMFPMKRSSAALLLLLGCGFTLFAQQPPKKTADTAKPTATETDLSQYKTVKEAKTADPKTFKNVITAKPTSPGYLGVEIVEANMGLPVVGEVAPGSPAEEAGLKTGDFIKSINGITRKERGYDLGYFEAKAQLRAVEVDVPVTFEIVHKGKAEPIKIIVTPRALSKPMTPTAAPVATRAVLGITVGDPIKTGGVEVTVVGPGGGADNAGVKEKDIILAVDEKKLDDKTTLRDVLNGKKPGDVIVLSIKREKKELDLRATLSGDDIARPGPGGGRNPVAGGWDDRIPSAWKKPVYKLAVIGVEYPDVKHNEKIKDEDWNASLFSKDKYTDKSATGQRVFGSVADYYKEISYGTLKVEGNFVGWVEVSKKRMEYSTGSGTSTREKTSLLTEAMDKLLAKDKDALKDMDGVFFLYAGGRIQNATRGSLYWPHRASVSHNNKRWPYFIVQEGAEKMTDISVFCHEFGHMLGLPDLYARPEVPGMEGVGVWCAMANQLPNGRPQHFSAWSKEQLGWVKPTMIDPRTKQKLILAPIEDDNTQCFKVPIKADGSEYLLLENRKKKGWDTELPAEGLLIWRVIPGNGTQKVFLEESHGVEGPSGPRSFLGAVPFPSPANDSFTPFTTPSSKSQTGGGFDVYITNVKRLPDGRVTFNIGYEFQ
jgi:M6 family metalloprotease-like protein